MAGNITANVKAEISWLRTDTDGKNSSVSSVGQVVSDLSLTLGSGQNQVDELVFFSGTLGSGITTSVDMFSIPVDLFGSVQNFSFSGGFLRAMAVKNLSNEVGAFMAVTISGTNSFDNLLMGHSGVIPIAPLETKTFINTLGDEWTVDSDQRFFYLEDLQGSGVSYEIILCGSSGA